jgi:GWxTD domain-containing protein
MNRKAWLKRLIVVVLLGILASEFALFKEVFAQEENPLGLQVDIAGFLNPSDTGRTYLEIYYSLRRQLLCFKEKEGAYTAEMQASLFLFTEAGDTVDQISWTNVALIPSLEALKDKGYLIIDQLGAVVEPGSYVLEVKVEDRLSESLSSLKKKITVPRIGGLSLSLSDIELGYLVEPDTTRGVFYKNGYRVMPAPPGEFDPLRNLIYFYAEIYGLESGLGLDSTYTVAYSALSEEGKPYKDFSSKTYRKPVGTAVIMSGINPVGLPSGGYFLRLEVTDNATGETVTGQKRFSVTESIDRLAAKGAVWDLAESHPEAISINSEKDAQLIRNQILYLAGKRELQTYDGLNLTGKDNFIKSFWEAKDPDPSTTLNEFKVQHYARWDYANERFSRFKGAAEERDGWKTDMGRVYIVYGPPDEVERYPSDLGTKPWEKWNYFGLQGQSQEGMAYFVFLDEDGFGSYKLIHSSVKGEIQTYNWESRILMGNIVR